MDIDTGTSSSEVTHTAEGPRGAFPGWEANRRSRYEGDRETHEVLHQEMPPQHAGNEAFLKRWAGEGEAWPGKRGAAGVLCPLCSTNIPP